MLYLKVLNARLFSNWLTFLASCCHLLPEITGMAEVEHVQDVKYILMTQTCTRVKQETYILTRWLMLTDNMYLVFRFFFFVSLYVWPTGSCTSVCIETKISSHFYQDFLRREVIAVSLFWCAFLLLYSCSSRISMLHVAELESTALISSFSNPLLLFLFFRDANMIAIRKL